MILFKAGRKNPVTIPRSPCSEYQAESLQQSDLIKSCYLNSIEIARAPQYLNQNGFQISSASTDF